MRYYKTLGVWKASNLQIDTNRMFAQSYGWWNLLDTIDGVVVLNTYNYSVSTVRHRYKTIALLDKLGLRWHVEIEAPRGLQDLECAERHYISKIKALESLMNNPRTRAAKNLERAQEILSLKEKLNIIKNLRG